MNIVIHPHLGPPKSKGEYSNLLSAWQLETCDAMITSKFTELYRYKAGKLSVSRTNQPGYTTIHVYYQLYWFSEQKFTQTTLVVHACTTMIAVKPLCGNIQHR